MQTRFRGLSLTETDRQKLEEMSRRSNLPAWQYKRCRALLLLDDGARISHVHSKLGCADHNVRRWVRTYQSAGLDVALTREHGGGVDKKLSPTEEQRVIALACSSPPEGQARWSVRLLAEHADRVLDGKRIGRETVRLVLNANDLKPWREKNVVRAKARRGIRRAHEQSARPV
jgi:transposase